MRKPRPGSEIGSSALDISGGTVREDILTQLHGPRGRLIYQQMADNDPMVGAVLLAIKHEAHRVDYSIEPAEDGDESNVEFVQSCFDDLTVHWDDTLSAIFSMLSQGFSVHEIVYKVRDGDGSDHDDGLVGWHKFARRPQMSIERWVLDAHGEPVGFWQRSPSAADEVFIPLDKCLHFKTTHETASPEGRSALRNAYRPWFYKQRIEEIEAVGVERDLAGIPKGTVPSEWMSQHATASHKESLRVMQEIVRNVHQDEAASVVVPAWVDEHGNQLVEFELLGSGGQRQFDTSQIITRYDTRIAMAIALADFVLLGHDKVGTQSLSASKIAVFCETINAWLDRICRVVTDQGIRRLLAINGLDGLPPQLTHSPVRQTDLGVLGAYIAALAAAGQLPPDTDLELQQHLRREGGLPDVPDELVHDPAGDYSPEPPAGTGDDPGEGGRADPDDGDDLPI